MLLFYTYAFSENVSWYKKVPLRKLLLCNQPHTYYLKVHFKLPLKSNFKAFKFTLKVTYGFETSLRKIQDLAAASVLADLLTEQQFITK